MDLWLNKSLRLSLEQYGSTENGPFTGPTLTTVVAGSSSSFPTLVVIFISSFPTFLTAEVSDTRTSSVVKSALYESFGSFKVGGTVGGNCGTWSGKICLVDSLWVERCHWR